VPAALEVQARRLLDAADRPISDDELGALAEQATDDPLAEGSSGDGP
jgi:hypothetical protein